MPTIEITARFEIRFTKALTDNQYANLENGMELDNFVDESDVYRRLATEGECEMAWDIVKPKKAKKAKKRR